MQMMIAVTTKLQILYPFVFYSYLTNYSSNMHKFWWACRSMGLLTTHQNSVQPDTVWPSKQFIYQNCSCSEMAANGADKISLKSDVLLNQYSNQLKTLKVLSKEWDHQVWGQSNFVWVTNHWFEDVRSCTLKSRQISRSSLSLLHTLWCVFYTFILSISLYSSSSSSSFLWGCRLRFSICGSQKTT